MVEIEHVLKYALRTASVRRPGFDVVSTAADAAPAHLVLHSPCTAYLQSPAVCRSAREATARRCLEALNLALRALC